MSRLRLPHKRPHELRTLEFRGRDYVVGVGRFDDGSIGEIFIDPAKPSCDDLSHVARDAAVTLSIAAQYGAPLDAVRDAVTRDSNGAPSGLIGAVLDLLAEGER